MIITIAGTPGSGKSTIAPILKQTLLEQQSREFEIVDVGQLRRDAAKEKGMTIEEFNDWSKNNPEMGDKAFDDYVKKSMQKKRDAILIGRMAFHMIPHSVKVFIDVSPEVGAKRIFKEKESESNRNEQEVKSVEDQIKHNKDRIDNDIKRFEAIYSVNPYDKSNFDIVIDSSNLNPEQIVDKILEDL